MRVNITIVKKVIGTSTIVRAAASMNGWYIAAFACLTTMGRCAKRGGISAIEDKAGQSKELARLSQLQGKWNTTCYDVQEENTPAREVLCCLIFQSEKDRAVDKSLNNERTIGSQHRTLAWFMGRELRTGVQSRAWRVGRE